MIRKLHVRQEITGLNIIPTTTRVCAGLFPDLIYFFGHWFLYPVLNIEAKGPGFGIPVQKPVPKAFTN